MSGGRLGARAAMAALGVLVAMAFGAVSASAETVEFKPAAEQPFTVPAGVSQLEVLAVGGAGEEGHTCIESPESGGSGAKVNAMLSVSGGETLKVRFGGGGAGGTGACANGGAGGGRSELLGSSPLVVAGGGGGSGANYGGGIDEGGHGGNANALVGESGKVGFFFGGYFPDYAGGGGEGGGASPGKGGAGGESFECVSGFAGVLQTGGEGGGPGPVQQCEGGGGGGGGHTGGGGGGSGFEGGGGGGAGSSFIAAGATGSVASGAGEAQKVLITYTVPITVQERLTNLLKAVKGVGPGKALTEKVKAIQGDVAANNKAGACTELTGLVSVVKAQKEKKQITKAQAEQFTKEANEIKTALGC
jgi:hypothetical protein